MSTGAKSQPEASKERLRLHPCHSGGDACTVTAGSGCNYSTALSCPDHREDVEDTEVQQTPDEDSHRFYGDRKSRLKNQRVENQTAFKEDPTWKKPHTSAQSEKYSALPTKENG